MKRGTPDHPKMKRLARLLNVNLAQAIGIMESLWHWTAKYAQAGDIGKYEDADIAEACFWDGDSDALLSALVSALWLDTSETCENCRLFVHDWHEHADDSVHLFLARHGMTFANGVTPSTSRLSKSERESIKDRSEHKRTKSALKCSLPSPSPSPITTKGESVSGNDGRSGKPSFAIEDVYLLFEKGGGPRTEADKFWNHYDSNGWKVGKNKMVSLAGAVGGWICRWRENGSNTKPSRQGHDRNAGTSNAKTIGQYDGIGKVV